MLLLPLGNMKTLLALLLLPVSACVENEYIGLPLLENVSEIKWEREPSPTTILLIGDTWFLYGMEELNRQDVANWYASLEQKSIPVSADDLSGSLLQGELILTLKGNNNQLVISFYLKGNNWYIHN